MSLFFVEKDAAPTPILCWILRLFASHFPPLALPVSAGFTNNNQWLLEEGGELLAPETKGMILDFIRSIHAVYFRWQNDLSHIIV